MPLYALTPLLSLRVNRQSDPCREMQGPPAGAAVGIAHVQPPYDRIDTNDLNGRAFYDYLQRTGGQVPAWAREEGVAATPQSCDALYALLRLSGVRVSGQPRRVQWSDTTFLRSVASLLGTFYYLNGAQQFLAGAGEPGVRIAGFVPDAEGPEHLATFLFDRYGDLFARAATSRGAPLRQPAQPISPKGPIGFGEERGQEEEERESEREDSARAQEWRALLSLLHPATDVADVGDVATDLGSQLWACASHATTQQPSAELRQVLLAPQEAATQERLALLQEALNIGRVRIVTYANERLYASGRLDARTREDAPPIEYFMQPINGDGACLYRSLASALVQRLTGHNLREGVAFDSAAQYGTNDAWRTENYARSISAGGAASGVLAVILNGITKWVKFYVYLVLCSDDIPPDSISYLGGVRGVDRIRPLYGLADMLEPDIAQRIMGSSGGPYAVPSLDLIVRYALWLMLAIQGTLQYVPQSRAYVQTLSWAQVRPYFLPLLAIPWDATGQQHALPVGKSITFFDANTLLIATVAVQTLLQDSDEYRLALERSGGTDIDYAYRAYCATMRQSARWGGAGEVNAFASVLTPNMNSFPLNGVGGANIFTYVDTQQAAALEPQIVPRQTGVDPATHAPAHLDYRPNCLAVLFNNDHYTSLHALVVNQATGAIGAFVPSMSETQLAAFVRSGPSGIEEEGVPATLAVQAAPAAPRPSPFAQIPSPALGPRLGPPALSRTVLPQRPTPRAQRRLPPPSPLQRGVPSPTTTGGGGIPSSLAEQQHLLSSITSLPSRAPPTRQEPTAAAAVARALLESIVEPLTDILPVDALRDSLDLREQFRQAGEAAQLPRNVVDAVWRDFANRSFL